MKKITFIRLATFLVLLFATTISYSQVISPKADGSYCPGPGAVDDEYKDVIPFTPAVIGSGTCAIQNIWAVVSSGISNQDDYLKLGFKIGNAGTALFRIYIDSDNKPNTGLSDAGGETDIEVSVIPSVAGATVSFLIEPLGLENPILTYEYSLDGTNYQTSNIFTGQANGSYTIYVKDNFNCVTTKNYEVTDSGTRDPYLFISQANSLIFAENESVDDCNIFRNDNNSLANQSLSDVVYCAENVYKPCDTITLQFKSNYDDPKVYIRFEDGSADQLLTLTKQTLNLNKFQYLDTWYYEYAPGKLGLYFLSGDTYDETGLPNGTFNLNGNLPDFAIIGQIITIDVLGTFIIQDVAFDSTIQRKVIVIDYTYVGLPTQTRVKSIYDILPYEIYEFTIDWSVYGIGLYDILISNEDSINGTVQHLSENIAIQDVIEKHLSIRYYNKNNRDIFYKFGI